MYDRPGTTALCSRRPTAGNRIGDYATVSAASSCTRRQSHCTPKRGTRSIDLTLSGRHARFSVGSSLTVSFTKAGYIGMVWVFHIRSGRLPTWRAVCLAPGSVTPGRGC